MNTIDRLKILELRYADYLKKALKHLEYSIKKTTLLPRELDSNTEETLESWEGLTTRFARVVDIFLTKYLKILVKIQDPIFDGTLRDFLNVAEKMNLINDVDHWLSLRELRNIQAHDYTDEAFQKFISSVLKESSFVVDEMKRLGLYASQK